MSEPLSQETVRRLVPRADVLTAFATATLVDVADFRDDCDQTIDQDSFSRDW